MATWKLGGHNTNSASADTFYAAERGTTVYSGRETTGTGYIGLMYPSDYGYAVLAASCARTTTLNNYNNDGCYNQNWLYSGSYQWTITPISLDPYNVWYVYDNGILFITSASYVAAARPSLYLKSNTTIISGDGTAETPYVLGE